MYGIPVDETKRVLGDAYLENKWQKSSILLGEQKLLEGYLTRYDIARNELEIKTTKGIKVLPAKLVKGFITIDSLTQSPKYFLNAAAFQAAPKAAK